MSINETGIQALVTIRPFSPVFPAISCELKADHSALRENKQVTLQQLKILQRLLHRHFNDINIHQRLPLLVDYFTLFQNLIQDASRLLYTLEQDNTAWARLIAQLQQECIYTLHLAFKHAVLDAETEPAGWLGAKKLKTQAVFWSMNSAWQALSIWSQTYTPPVNGFWQDVHRLFTYACHYGIAQKTVASGMPTIEHLYHRLLLWSMASSNKLESAKQNILFSLLEYLAPSLQLQNLPEGELEPSFVLHPGKDSGIRYLANGIEDNDRGMVRILEPSKVLNQLHGKLEQLRYIDFAPHNEIQLIQKLHHDWSTPPQRRHPRLKQYRREAVELIRYGSIDHAVTEHPEELPLPPWISRSTPVNCNKFDIQDRSLSGILLRGRASHISLHAGELVMWRRLNQEWQLGLIRWIHYIGEDIQCGVETIGKQPEQIYFTPNVSLPSNQVISALLLKTRQRTQTRGVLIAPGRLYQPLREFFINLPQQAEPVLVQAIRLITQTGHWQVFEIREKEEESGR